MVAVVVRRQRPSSDFVHSLVVGQQQCGRGWGWGCLGSDFENSERQERRTSEEKQAEKEKRGAHKHKPTREANKETAPRRLGGVCRLPCVLLRAVAK